MLALLTHSFFTPFSFSEGLFATVGCHPCRAQEFDTFPAGPEAYLKAMITLIEEDRASGKDRVVVAVGECGLGMTLYQQHL